MSDKKKPLNKQSSEGSSVKSLSDFKLDKRVKETEQALQVASEVAVNRQQHIEQLTEELRQRDEKIRNLEHMIQKMIPRLGSDGEGLVKITDEEVIVLEQIERLKIIAKQRQMTPDEVKMLDTLIKNKRLLQGKSTSINADYEKIKDLDEVDLLKIASKK